MVLFLFSFKDITDTHGKSHHNGRKEGKSGDDVDVQSVPQLLWVHPLTWPQQFFITEDKRCSRKASSSHFTEARRRGRTVLYHLTSQFSKRSKSEVKLSSVSTDPVGQAGSHSSGCTLCSALPVRHYASQALCKRNGRRMSVDTVNIVCWFIYLGSMKHPACVYVHFSK